MTVLREYKQAECDERGVPLDWERCRTCDENGLEHFDDESGVWVAQCFKCGGHGSLKAAALAGRLEFPPGTKVLAPHVITIQEWRQRQGLPPRCEDCAHPMSEGTWEIACSPATPWDAPVGTELWALEHLRQGHEPPHEIVGCAVRVHYSPCDEGCRHTGPARIRDTLRGELDGEWLERAFNPEPLAVGGIVHGVEAGYEVEASWRSVDIRTGQPAPPGAEHPMLWTRPWDLRPENMAVLCLRCWASQ